MAFPPPVEIVWKSGWFNEGSLEDNPRASGKQARRERAQDLVRADARGLLRRSPGLPRPDRFGAELRFFRMDRLAARSPSLGSRRGARLSRPRHPLRAPPAPRAVLPFAGPGSHPRFNGVARPDSKP